MMNLEQISGSFPAHLHLQKQAMLRERISELFDHVDLNELAAEVQPFLFHPEDDRRVRYFQLFWEQVAL